MGMMGTHSQLMIRTRRHDVRRELGSDSEEEYEDDRPEPPFYRILRTHSTPTPLSGMYAFGEAEWDSAPEPTGAP
jgi:hypothetical protein